LKTCLKPGGAPFVAAQRCVFARLQEKVPRRKYGASCRQETNVCGYVYDPVKGDPENGVSPGTEFKACRVQGNCELMCIALGMLWNIPSLQQNHRLLSSWYALLLMMPTSSRPAARSALVDGHRPGTSEGLLCVSADSRTCGTARRCLRYA
jgi:rubredoxin